MRFEDRINKLVHYMIDTEMTQTEIAEEMGVARSTLYNDRVTEEFKTLYKEELEKRMERTRDTFKKNLEFAHKELLELIRYSDDESIKLNAIKYYIDKSLGKNTTHIQSENNINNHSVVDDDDILAAFDRLDDVK